MTFTFADIFSGCGGFTSGFASSGEYSPAFAVDSWDVALSTLKKNFPNAECLNLDLSIENNIAKLAETLAGTDVLLGGPPCQGFSTLGKRRDGDNRSTLVDSFAELVLKVRPAVVVVENVRGITSKRHPTYPTYADALLAKLQGGGRTRYVCDARLVNASDFGIAQSRVRWFLVGVRADLGYVAKDLEAMWEGIESLRKPSGTVRDAIGDLPPLQAGERASKMLTGEPLYNHQAMRHSQELVARLRCVPPNGGLPDVPIKLLTPHLKKMLNGGYGSGGHVKNIYGRLDWEQPSGTIVAGIDKITCGRFVHPDQDRLLTPRECARLQSFDDSFEIVGGQVAQYYQVGNAVPPALAAALARMIRPLVSRSKISRDKESELAA